MTSPFTHLSKTPVPAAYYDRDYFVSGKKSAYGGYGPAEWTTWLTDMVVDFLKPTSVLDIGCATGPVVLYLQKRGVSCQGFDLSAWAIEHTVTPGSTWIGSAEDPAAYEGISVDLAIASELAEHLIPQQAKRMLQNTRGHAKRFLLLICVDMGDDADPTIGDHTHINVRPMSWWEELARKTGWTVADASRFNDDERSVRMGWAGRFLYLTQEG